MKLFKRKIDGGLVIVLLAIAAYTVFLSFASICRYQSFHATYDMSVMVQTIWNTSQGRILIESVNFGYPTPRFWYAHWEFIYIPIAIFYRLWSSPLLLLILQTFVLAMGALPIYLLAKDHLSNKLVATLLAISYLLYPALQNSNLSDIHGVTFSTSFLLFAFYFLQKNKAFPFSIFALLALLCREDVALILLMMGFYCIFILKKRNLGIAVSLISLLWFIAFIQRSWLRTKLGFPPLVYPAETPPSHWAHLNGEGRFSDVLIAIFTHPLRVLKTIFNFENLKYLIKLLAPVGFISFFNWQTLILAAPTVIINVLSDWLSAKGIEAQYTATVTPFVFISAVYGIKKLAGLSKRKFNVSSEIFVGSVILSLSLFAFLSKSNVFSLKKWRATDHHRRAEKIISQIPRESSLSADSFLRAHAAHRQRLFALPDSMYSADYILYDFLSIHVKYKQSNSFEALILPPINEPILQLLNNRDYGICKYDDGIALFKKGYPYNVGVKNLAIATQSEVKGIKVAPRRVTENIKLVGWQEPNIKGKYGTIIQCTFYWQATENIEEDYQFRFFTLFNDKEIEIEHKPVFGVYGTSKWEPGKIIRDILFIQTPKVITAGDSCVINLIIENAKDEKISNEAVNPIVIHKF